MLIRKTLVPGKIKILKSLESGCKSYTQLKKETGLSDPTVSEYVKWLWKKDYINRDIDSRKYALRPKGKYLLPISDLVDELNQVLRSSQTKPVESNIDFQKLIEQMPKDLQKNYAKMANCVSIIHHSLTHIFPQIIDLYGETPLVRSKRLPNDKIIIEFKRQNNS